MLPSPKPPRATTSPHGVPVSTLFYGRDIATRDFKDANKIKTLDVHPTLPWVATADEAGNVAIWDYDAEAIVLSFTADSIKDGQRSAVEALDLHGAFAAAQDVAVPDVAGPGLGVGAGADPGVAAGGATEAFVSERVAAIAAGVTRSGGGGNAPGGAAAVLLAGLAEDPRTARTGAVRSVRFADEHVLAWACGRGRGDYDAASAAHSDCDPPPTTAIPVASQPLASSLEDLEALLMYTGEGASGFFSRSGGAAGVRPAATPVQPSWLIIICDLRVLLLDYSTRAVIDLPPSALLIEASGPQGMHRTTTRGKASVHSATLVGPGVLALGCEDGAVRVWSLDANATIQVVRAPGGSTRPVIALHTFATSPHLVGTTASMLSPSCALGAAAATAATLIVSGSGDCVNVWEVIGGRMLADNGRGGLSQLRLGGDLVDVTLAPLSHTAVALSSDKSVTVWDATSRGAAGGAPRAVSSKLTCASSAAEGGVGSRLTSAVSLGGHPFFPPGSLIVAGKGPHLELAVSGAVVSRNTLVGGNPVSADAGALLYDLRTARPHLPSKLKVYTLVRHPWRPDIIAAGTNIGVFVVSLAPAYSFAAAVVGHPSWSIAPAVLGEGEDASSSPLLAGRPVVRAGTRVLHVTAAGALVASECTIATPANDDDVATGLLPPFEVVSSSSSRGALGAASACVLQVSQVEHILLSTFAPAIPPPSLLGPVMPGVPPPVPNALAHLAALLKGPGGAAGAPGCRGVRLRLSGSGRYLGAIWPEHRCWAVYKIAPPEEHLPEATGAVDVSAEGEEGGAATPGLAPPAAALRGWSCDYIEGGSGVDLAWSGQGIRFDDRHAKPEVSLSDPPGTSRRFERFVVLETGTPITGRGPMGGGMAIGSSAPSAKAGSGAAGKKDVGAAAAPVSTVKVSYTPAVVSLRQLPLLADAHADVGRPLVLAADVAFSSDPVALWGGPLLAVALASHAGAAASASGNTPVALATASLAFFGWDLLDPDATQEAEEAARLGGTSDSRYSGAATARAPRPRFPPAGVPATVPSPSFHGSVSGCGVSWAPCGSRLAITTPFNVHVAAFLPPRRLMQYGGARGGSASSRGISTPAGIVVELCRVPLLATGLSWHGGSLLCVSTSLDGPLISAIYPPLLDPHPLAEIALAGGGGGSSSFNPLTPHGNRLMPLVITLQSTMPSAFFPGYLHASAFPPPARGMALAWGAAPICVARGHALFLHWVGPRKGGASAGALCSALSIAAPALRACTAASSASVWDDRSASHAFLEAVRNSAVWGARAPVHTHTELAWSLASMGALASALMLPGLTTTAGVGLALSARPAIAAGLPWRLPAAADDKGGRATFGNVRNSGGGPRFAAVDGGVAVAYLRRVIRTAPGSDIEALAGPPALSPSDTRGGMAFVESESNVLGAWPSVAAILAIAATHAPLEERILMLNEVAAFARRLARLGLHSDALLVAAVKHSPYNGKAPPPPPAGGSGAGATQDVSGMELIMELLKMVPAADQLHFLTRKEDSDAATPKPAARADADEEDDSE